MIECSFCSEINHEEEYNLLKEIIYPIAGLKTRILFETKNWVVIPTIGCFNKGYILIVSKEHIQSMAVCPREYLEELEQLILKIKKMYIEIYKSPVIIFEHGAISNIRRGACCVNHLHLHIVPFEGNIFEELIVNDTEYEIVKVFIELQYAVIKHNKAYIFYEDNHGNRHVLFNDFFPSQFIRQIICKKMGKADDWDWRNKLFVDNIVNTIEDFKCKEHSIKLI